MTMPHKTDQATMDAELYNTLRKGLLTIFEKNAAWDNSGHNTGTQRYGQTAVMAAQALIELERCKPR